MQKGSAFQKLRGHKKFSRVYKLSSNLTSLTWYPTRTRGSKILVSDIKRVKRGINLSRNNVFPSSAISYSLTIFLKSQTVELLATTNDAADIWLVGLRYLVYRSTSHEHTVRGMWLSEEFNRLLETAATGDRAASANTPTDSTVERNSSEHQIASSTTQDSFEGAADQRVHYSHENTYSQPLSQFPGDQQQQFPLSSSSSPATVSLQTCIARIKELSYYCAQFSLASLSARDNRNITEREFIEMYEFYSSMDPVLSFIFQFNSNGDDYLTSDELATFLRVEFPYLTQVDDVYLSTVVDHYEPVAILRSENCLGIDGLITYLLSPDLSVMNPFHTQVNQDMSHPITHYYINASHNSFLTGDQLYSQSSEEQVRKLLMEGVRHIEVDVWDGPDGEPEVYHGYTSTSKLKLLPLLHAIRDSAFLTSLYPVVLDVENHCSIPQQIKMAHYLRDVFKESLFLTKAIDNFDISTVPLVNLRGKVFVKCKRIPLNESILDAAGSPTLTNYCEVSDENSADELPSHCKTFANTPTGNPDVIATHSEKKGNSADNYEMLPLYEQRRKQHILLGRRPTLALSRYLSALVSIRSKAFNMDRLEEEGEECGGVRERNVVYQMDEREAVLQVRQKFFDISLFCETSLLKLSPSPSRVNSSNPDPVQFWNAGIQIVALNQQKQQHNDKAIRFNKALFKSNGNCGYCLKPIYAALGNQESLDLEVMFFFVSRIQAFIQSPVAAMPSHRWTLQVEIKGHMNDTSTRYIDCMNLPSSGEKFSIQYPSMAFLCLTLYEELSKSRKFSADFVIPVTSIAAGFKVVPLLGPSSCVVIVDINANSKPPPKEKRRKSFLKLGKSNIGNARKIRLGDLKDSNNRQSFEIYQSHSFRFSRTHNVSTPNLVSAAMNANALQSPTEMTAHRTMAPRSALSMNNDFGPGYEAHCATVGVPNSSTNFTEYLTTEQRMTMDTNSLRTRNRSSIHDLAMDSIANLFKENNDASMVRNQVLLGKSALMGDRSHYQLIGNGDTRNNHNANSPQAMILSSEELRARMYEEYANACPIYDSPLEDQVSQSCHNSPLHQETIDHYKLNNKSAYSQSTSNEQPSVSAASYCETSSSYILEASNERSFMVNKERRVSDFQNGRVPMKTVDSSSQSSRGLVARSQQNVMSRRLERPSPSTRYSGSVKGQRTGKYLPTKGNSGYRREAKSVIRGRASSLSDNDQFSSDEDLNDSQFTGDAYNPHGLLSDATSGGQNRSSSLMSGGREACLDVEENLNLSNLAAEIEEEFGGALSIDQGGYSDEDEDLILYSQSNEDNNTSITQNPAAKPAYKMRSQNSFDVANSSKGLPSNPSDNSGIDTTADESFGGASSSGTNGAASSRSRAAYTRQTSGYESGLESPSVASKDEIGSSAAEETPTSQHSTQHFFYQTTMV